MLCGRPTTQVADRVVTYGPPGIRLKHPFLFLISQHHSSFEHSHRLLSSSDMKKKKLASVKVEKTVSPSSISPSTPPRLTMAPQGVEEFLESLKE